MIKQRCWTVYILICGDNSLYTGMTKCLTKRLRMHEAGQGAKYTKGRGPFVLGYREDYEDRRTAAQREFAIKKLKAKKKWALVEKG